MYQMFWTLQQNLWVELYGVILSTGQIELLPVEARGLQRSFLIHIQVWSHQIYEIDKVA